jgi:plasmid stabilization system protein ParE
MELTIFWTQFAKDKLNDIIEHYKIKVNFNIASKLADSKVDHTASLENQPYIGQKKTLLLDRS